MIIDLLYIIYLIPTQKPRLWIHVNPSQCGSSYEYHHPRLVYMFLSSKIGKKIYKISNFCSHKIFNIKSVCFHNDIFIYIPRNVLRFLFQSQFLKLLRVLDDFMYALVNTSYVVEYELISTQDVIDNMVDVNSVMHHICVNRC